MLYYFDNHSYDITVPDKFMNVKKYKIPDRVHNKKCTREIRQKQKYFYCWPTTDHKTQDHIN